MAQYSANNILKNSCSVFEKYRIVQDRLFVSDFDRVIRQIESSVKPDTDEE